MDATLVRRSAGIRGDLQLPFGRTLPVLGAALGAVSTVNRKGVAYASRQR